MIELGKNNSIFYVQGSDNLIAGQDKHGNPGVLYKGFSCWIIGRDKTTDSFELKLTNLHKDEYIPIVI